MSAQCYIMLSKGGPQIPGFMPCSSDRHGARDGYYKNAGKRETDIVFKTVRQLHRNTFRGKKGIILCSTQKS